MDFHKEKFASLLHKLAADFFERESNRDALITVTKVDFDESKHKVFIHLSVLPKDKIKDVLPFAIRKRSDLRSYVMKNIKSRSIPTFDIIVE